MKHKYYLIPIIIIVVAGICFFYCPFIIHAPTAPEGVSLLPNGMTMRITSPVFTHNEAIPALYTCDGKNISPPLVLHDIPENAQSLVLIMDDPDVPAQAGVPVWDHWIVLNIPSSVKVVEEGKNPEGVIGRNSSGSNAYGAPCPPDREHRYFFKLYALDTMLSLSAGVSKKEVEEAMKGHIIAQAELIGRYNRQR